MERSNRCISKFFRFSHQVLLPFTLGMNQGIERCRYASDWRRISKAQRGQYPTAQDASSAALIVIAYLLITELKAAISTMGTAGLDDWNHPVDWMSAKDAPAGIADGMERELGPETHPAAPQDRRGCSRNRH